MKNIKYLYAFTTALIVLSVPAIMFFFFYWYSSRYLPISFILYAVTFSTMANLVFTGIAMIELVKLRRKIN